MAVAKDLAETLTNQDDDKAILVQSMLDNHQQYLTAFRAQADKWIHLDICPMRAVERFIRHGKMVRDNWFAYLGASPIKPDHVEACLDKVISQLIRYEDTYHLALLNDRKYPDDPLVKSIWQDFWSVKVPVNGQSTLFWEEWPVNECGRRMQADHQLTGSGITRAFIDMYSSIWRDLPEDMLIRDKEAVIEYLTNQGRKLPTAYN
jgi:hypothetical protein